MLNQLKGVLTNEELARLRALAARLQFVDGRVTNPNSTVKNNLQIPQNDPASDEPGLVVRAAIFRHPDIRAIAQPKQMARPTLAKYQPGMNYGAHVDEALFPSKPTMMRSDVSCTVFISAADEYEGGELVIDSGAGEVVIKGEAGDAVLYPSNTVHRVNPVIEGERLVAITWFQSMVRDPGQREILYRLHQVLAEMHAAGDRSERRVQLEAIRTNLLRMWAEL